MPFRICKSFEIESGHMLSKHPGKCRFPHGHSRRIEVVLAADTLDANDMVCDFKALKEALRELIDRWDHAMCLNDADPQFAFHQQTYGAAIVPFKNTDPTSEILAREVFRETQRRLQATQKALAESAGSASVHQIGHAVRLERVRVTETSSSWAEYFE
jgi:6-pyruvoyltetrahydropterin/6-carboxytetrahydropterin synthase